MVIWSSGFMVLWSIWSPGNLVIWPSGHLVIWSFPIFVKTLLFLWNTWMICAHSESCFGDLIEQSGYLVFFCTRKKKPVLIITLISLSRMWRQTWPNSQSVPSALSLNKFVCKRRYSECSRGLHIVGVCWHPVANPCLKDVKLHVASKLEGGDFRPSLATSLCHLQVGTMPLRQNDGILR